MHLSHHTHIAPLHTPVVTDFDADTKQQVEEYKLFIKTAATTTFEELGRDDFLRMEDFAKTLLHSDFAHKYVLPIPLNKPVKNIQKKIDKVKANLEAEEERLKKAVERRQTLYDATPEGKEEIKNKEEKEAKEEEEEKEQKKKEKEEKTKKEAEDKKIAAEEQKKKNAEAQVKRQKAAAAATAAAAAAAAQVAADNQGWGGGGEDDGYGEGEYGEGGDY